MKTADIERIFHKLELDVRSTSHRCGWLTVENKKILRVQMGMSADEVLTTLPHLTPAQVHSALAYYFDHQDEVDADLAGSSDMEFWRSQIEQESNNTVSQA